MQIDDQFRQLLCRTEADPMVVHFADVPRIMVSAAACVHLNQLICKLCCDDLL